ncbi:hypothetical protein U9M48_021667 [Paspalum notatum var. saurae]|uniref:Eukaryotic translation initiation factor 3 subunit G n=1 Tax=Paspalum notatum var. saurae TaxID=547442 RepID=A0AAQ3TI02_PASNO
MQPIHNTAPVRASSRITIHENHAHIKAKPRNHIPRRTRPAIKKKTYATRPPNHVSHLQPPKSPNARGRRTNRTTNRDRLDGKEACRNRTMAAAAAMQLQQQHHRTERWGDLLDDGELGLEALLPPKVVVGPDAQGLKKVIEYRIDDDGNKVKVTTTTRVRTVRRSKRAIERRAWAKFGDAATEVAGSRLTMVSTEEIILDRTSRDSSSSGSKNDEASNDSLTKTNKDGGGFLMVCRTCGKKGDHWTSKCPYKDLASQQSLTSLDMPPSSDDSASQGGGADNKSAAYVPKFRRLGPDNTSGAEVMRRRNDENSIRVTNLSEDTRDPDLAELFGQFGPLSRVFVALDRATGVSRGFGFVNFVHREDGERAIRKLDKYGYDNLILHVEWAAPRPNN